MRRARLNPPVLYRHLLSLAMIALAAVLAGLMFDALVALGASTRAASGTAALLMLSPPLLIFSVLFFTELLSALLCFLVFYRILSARHPGHTALVVARLPDRIPVPAARAQHRPDDSAHRARAAPPARPSPSTRSGRLRLGSGRARRGQNRRQLPVLGHARLEPARSVRGLARMGIAHRRDGDPYDRPARRSGVRTADLRAGVRARAVGRQEPHDDETGCGAVSRS